MQSSLAQQETERILDMFKSLAKSTNKSIQEIEEEFLNENIIKKLADPKDIANLIIYLSSDISKNITGTTVTSDGGGVNLYDKPKGAFQFY